MAKQVNFQGADNVMVSIIILTKNGGDLLKQNLNAILGQDISYNYEILCIDSGSTDSTLELLKKYPIKLFTIPEHKFNHGLTRNFAISLAQGQYIVLINQDVVPFNAHWLNTLVGTLEADRRIAGVYCRHIPTKDADPFIKRRTYKTYPPLITPEIRFIKDSLNYNALTPKQKFQLCFFDNVCSCIRKSVWEELPFADTNFAEDLEWAKGVLEKGYKIVYQSEALIIHAHNRPVEYEYKRAYLQYRKVYELFHVPHQIFLVLLLRRIFISGLSSLYFALKEEGIREAVTYFKRIFSLSLVDALAQWHAIKDHRLKLPYRFNSV